MNFINTWLLSIWVGQALFRAKKIVLENVVLEPKDIQETDFNLDGIFVRWKEAINSIGAKRVVLNSLESLFAGITDIGILRLKAV